MKNLRLLLFAGALSLVLSCGDSTAPTQPAVTTPSPAPPAGTATPAPPAAPTPTPASSAAHIVRVGPQGSRSFSDSQSGGATTTIRVGTMVTWQWEGGPHSVTSGNCCSPDGRFDSGVKSSGSFSQTFLSAGTFPYFCTVHGSMMTGSVVVNP